MEFMEESETKVLKPKSPGYPLRHPQHSQPQSSAGRQTSSPAMQSPVAEERQSMTLYVGDSISGNIHFDALEKGMKSKIVSAKAYSSITDTVANDVSMQQNSQLFLKCRKVTRLTTLL